MKRILAIGVILLFIGSISSSTGFNAVEQSNPISSGKTLYVGGSGPRNYTKIQDAIDDASDGDTVFVYDDSSPYYEYNIEISKSINLIGESRNTTTIDGNASGNVVKINADDVTIKGFTIRRGGTNSERKAVEVSSRNTLISGNIIERTSNGIYITSASSDLIISDNIIQNNGWFGVYVEADNTTITNNHFQQNEHGIWVLSSTNYISNNSFFQDVKDSISVGGFGNTVIYNEINGRKYYSDGIGVGGKFNNVSFNTINSSDVGIEVGSSNSIFLGNSVSNSVTGISSHYWSEFNIFRFNIAQKNRNGFFISGLYNTVENNIITGNDEYGIVLSTSADVYVPSTCNTVRYNSISENEVGIGVSFVFNNEICYNNIIKNTRSATFMFSGKQILNATNNWHDNYWGIPLSQTKYITGKLRIKLFSYTVWWGIPEPYKKTVYLRFPWLDSDPSPASEPYDIGV